MNKKTLFLGTLLMFGACGEDTESIVDSSDDPSTTGGSDTSETGGGEEDPPNRFEGKGIFVSGDYAGNGQLSIVDLAEATVENNVVAGVVGGDPMVRRFGDTLFVLDRFNGDSVTALDQNAELKYQISVGAGANPQDIAVVGTDAFVVNFDNAVLSKFSVDASEPVASDFSDLSTLDAVDGLPDCHSIVAVGERLFVSCQLLDRTSFSNRGPGVVAVIDSTNGALLDTIELSQQNPLGLMSLSSSGTILVATVPNFLDTTMGCVESIVVGDADASYGGCEVQNSILGGYANKLVHVEETNTWLAAVATTFTSGKIMESTQAGWQAAGFYGDDSNPMDLHICEDGQLLVADNGAEGRGVRMFEALQNGWEEKTTEPLNVGWNENFSPTNAMTCW